MIRVLALLFVALAGTAHAHSPRIVGGTEVQSGEFGFQAGLHLAFKDFGDGLCGGALVAARWVLTAAHCLAEEPIDVDDSYAVIGTTDFTNATAAQRYHWEDAFYDPAYATGNGGHDLGLIRLARPANVEPVRLLRTDETALWAPGTIATALGWGYTDDRYDGGQLSPEHLRKVDLRIYSDADCRRAFNRFAAMQELDFTTELCALAPGRDACDGDSGGPLLVSDPATGQPALAGAVSFGVQPGFGPLDTPRSCNEGPPGVYSRLGADPLNAFIRANVPQVEVDRSLDAPVARQRIIFTAHPNAPSGTGPFGGYDNLVWDLNGDGAFEEARNRASVGARFDEGLRTVAVRATTMDGDRESRRIGFTVGPRSTIAFTRPAYVVRAGRPVRIRLRRSGTGVGTVSVRASGGGARTIARTVRFSARQATREVRIRTRRRAKGSFALRLSDYTGQLSAGALGRVRVYFK